MKHCPELKNSSELGEDVEREGERESGGFVYRGY